MRSRHLSPLRKKQWPESTVGDKDDHYDYGDRTSTD
jgi:hypothetical protein